MPASRRLLEQLAVSPAVLRMFLIAVYCAILSTADTFLLASSQALLTDVFQIAELEHASRYDQVDQAVNMESEKTLLITARWSNLVLAALAFAVCGTMFLWLGIGIIPILFAVCGGQIALGPAVIYGLLKTPRDEEMPRGALRSFRLKAGASVVCGYTSVLAGWIIGVIAMNTAPNEAAARAHELHFFWYSPIYSTVISWCAFVLAPRQGV